tara:strand:- start:88 stop:726 length:639 start_codon:yes stop_codon:yes gene_type:complete
MADIIIDGTTVINKTGDAITQTFPGPNHTFTVKAVNQPISGTTNSTKDQSTSDQWAIYNGSTKLFGVSEDGYVVKPQTPNFYAQYTGSNSATLTSNDELRFTLVHTNVGNHYDGTSRFTCPIDGTYLFYVQALGNNDGGRIIGYFSINGSTSYTTDKTIEYSHDSEEYNDFQGTAIVNLSAGDYIAIRMNTSYNRIYNSSTGQNVFMGYLLG